MADFPIGASPSPGGRQKRLLVVVDNDAAHLYYTSMILQRLEYNIHTTKTAKDALEMVDVADPALIVTETVLEGMSGIELLQKIKKNPKTFSLPVIVLTRSKEPETKVTCLQEGCTAFFQKPFEPDQLYAAIQKATETTPRQYIRLTTSLNVIVGDEKSAVTGTGDYITALSENGMFISMTKPKPVGLEVPVTIFLEESRIRVDAMVLYSFQRGEGPLKTSGMGLRFVRIDPDDQNIIRVFIKKAITKGLTMAHIGGTIL